MYRSLIIVVALSAGVGCVAGAQVPPSAKPSPSRVLVLEMKASPTGHQVTGSRIVDAPTPLKARNDSGFAAINYTVLDANERALAAGSFDDPRVVRGVLPPATENQTGHPTVVVDTISYVLRVPYSSSARFLKLSGRTSGDGSQKPAMAEQKIDLAPYIDR